MALPADIRINRIRGGLLQLGILYIILTLADYYFWMFLKPLFPWLMDIIFRHQTPNSVPNLPASASPINFFAIIFVGIIAYFLLLLPMINLFRGLIGAWKVGPLIVMMSIGALGYALYYLLTTSQVVNNSSQQQSIKIIFNSLHLLGFWVLLYVVGLLITSLGIISAGKRYQLRGLVSSGYIMLAGALTSFLPVLVVISSFVGYLTTPKVVLPTPGYIKVLKAREVSGDDVLNNRYVAGPEGIYEVMNLSSIALRGGTVAFFAAIALFVGLLGLLGAPMFAGEMGLSVYDAMAIYGAILAGAGGAAYYFYKNMEVKLRLVIPWKRIKSIVITNEHTISYFSRVSYRPLSPTVVSRTVGDYKLFLDDGSEVTISNVLDPYNKLNYLRTKYRLTV